MTWIGSGTEKDSGNITPITDEINLLWKHSVAKGNNRSNAGVGDLKALRVHLPAFSEEREETIHTGGKKHSSAARQGVRGLALIERK